MKLKLDTFPLYCVVIPAIAGATLIALFSITLMERFIYPRFKRLAYRNVPEPEYNIQLDEKDSMEMPAEEREEMKKKVVAEYMQMYGANYEDHLKEDIAKARDQIGNLAYERVWGGILDEFDEEKKK